MNKYSYSKTQLLSNFPVLREKIREFIFKDDANIPRSRVPHPAHVHSKVCCRNQFDSVRQAPDQKTKAVCIVLSIK